MAVRKRTITDTSEAGLKESWDSAGNPAAPVHYTKPTKNWYCGDEIGTPGAAHALEIQKNTLEANGCSGTLKWTGKEILHYRLTNVIPDYSRSGSNTLSLSSPTDVQILSRMTFSKPAVDLPLFLFELKDLPGMAKQAASFAKSLPEAIRLIRNAMSELIKRQQAGNNTLRGAAELSLAANFGWAPLLADLNKLIGFGQAFDRRRAELAKIAQGNSVRKKITIDENNRTTVEHNIRIGVVAGVAEIYGTRTKTVTSRKWATVQWHAADPGNLPSLPTDWDVAKSLAGLEYSLATAWNAIPFSFLIDYFTTIGDFLETKRNNHLYSTSHFCIMEKHTSTCTWSRGSSHGSDDKWCTGGSGRETIESKYRRHIAGSPLPTLHPFMNARQVSNLTSLAVARSSTWR